MFGDFFFTDTPRRFTRSGKTGCARENAILDQHLGDVKSVPA